MKINKRTSKRHPSIMNFYITLLLRNLQRVASLRIRRRCANLQASALPAATWLQPSSRQTESRNQTGVPWSAQTSMCATSSRFLMKGGAGSSPIYPDVPSMLLFF
ncbi:hypothetical protein I7I48_05712 [Histoplasma ohiense]|nr:hypothetical protein I7I48_05712 [Histoplasma ohiense (nom. inval.)]